MRHVRLLTALPARPQEPGPPAMRHEVLLEQCREALRPDARAAVDALVELHSLEPDAEEGTVRERFERALDAADRAGGRALRRWIEQGAPAPEETVSDPKSHWAYQTPARPVVPQVANTAWVS